MFDSPRAFAGAASDPRAAHEAAPSLEQDRLAVLRSYRVIGAAPDAGLRHIVGLTSASLGMPMAWISLVDESSEWIAASTGVDLLCLSRRGLPCEPVIAERTVLVANEAECAWGRSGRPLARHVPGLRFCAVAPLVTAKGHPIGTLSILDTQPHPEFGPVQRAMLASFATLGMDRLEARRSALADTAAVGFAKASEFAFVVVDATGAITFCNPAADALFGYGAGEMLGQNIEIIIPEPLRAAHRAGFRRIVAGGASHLAGRSTVELTALHRDGRTFPIEFSMSLWQEAGGVGLGAIIRDISEWHIRDARLVQLAHHDKLTGLTNRALFDERLEASLGTGRHATVMLLDLDGFKEVNDRLGHATGDLLLRAVAARLSACASPDVTVARFGGDEFALLLAGEGDPLRAAARAGGILEEFQMPFQVAGHLFHVGLSIGVAIGCGASTAGDELIADADLALYQAKRDGRSCFRLFEAPMRSVVVARRALHDDLTRALESKELVLHYQPQVELRSGRVIGAEALLRWQHPTRGLLSPGSFIDALEAHPYAASIGRWVVEEACRQSAAWRAADVPPLRLAVNLFGAHLRKGSLSDEVLAALARHGVSPNLLEIEVTERIALQANDALLDPLRELHGQGVAIAFDDFGTGYASLSSLKRLPLTRLKIDRSFVRDILTDRHDAEIVRAVLGMAESFGLETIAEGIETAEQNTMLRVMGCREGQGYLFGRAMTADALAALAVAAPDGGRGACQAA